MQFGYKTNIQKFKESKIGYYSFLIILFLYLLSLCSELICNNKPLYLRYNDTSYFPIFKFYSEDVFLNNNKKTRVNYKEINNSKIFKNSKKNFMIFPPFRFNQFESIDPKSIKENENIVYYFYPINKKAKINIRKDFSILKKYGDVDFFIKNNRRIKSYFNDNFLKEIKKRFANQNASSISIIIKNEGIKIWLSSFKKRTKIPKSVRVHFSQINTTTNDFKKIIFNKEGEVIKGSAFWKKITLLDRKNIVENTNLNNISNIIINSQKYKIDFQKNIISFPYRPTKNHLLGIDSAGRDVLSRVVYGFRTSLSFALMIVFFYYYFRDYCWWSARIFWRQA